MTDSLSKKFISDHTIICETGDHDALLRDVWIARIRACIDEALAKAGVTLNRRDGCYDRNGTFFNFGVIDCAHDEASHNHAILYIQPAPKVRTAEERIAAAIAEAEGMGVCPSEQNCLHGVCRIVNRLRP